MNALRHFLLAVQFFSRIPVAGRLAAWTGWSPEMQRASAAHLPGVGWLVGLWAALLVAVAQWFMMPSHWAPLVTACISTAGTLWLTGGFHEDGLADVADGLGGFVPAERALEIMKDSRLGSYGVMTLVMTLLTKVALIAMLMNGLSPESEPFPIMALLWAAHVLSRYTPLVLMHCLPHVGLASSSKTLNIAGKQMGWSGLLTGAVWCLPAVALLWWLGSAELLLKALVVCALTTGLLLRWFRRRLGGMTGDCLGACQQLNELAILLAAAIVVPRFL